MVMNDEFYEGELQFKDLPPPRAKVAHGAAKGSAYHVLQALAGVGGEDDGLLLDFTETEVKDDDGGAADRCQRRKRKQELILMDVP